MVFNYECSQCGAEYEILPNLMVCPKCSAKQQPDEPVRGILEVKLVGRLTPQFSIFDLLPVEEKYFPPIPVGNTPLWEPRNIRLKTGFDHL